jgi:predicted methyltransferase
VEAEVRAALLALAFAAISAPALAQTYPTDGAMDAAFAASDRLPTAQVRDQRPETRIMMRFTHVKPGDRVLDVGAGGGYTGQLFSSLVGPAGHVDLHNSENWIHQLPGTDPDSLKQRIKRKNIGYIVTEFDAITGDDAS